MRFFQWVRSLFHKPIKSVDVTQIPPNLLKPDPQPTTSNPGLVNTGSTENPDYAYLWATCMIKPNSELQSLCDKINANKVQYEIVEANTKVPWYLIAALHYREASLDFNTYLGNGDPLDRPSTHVPKGRGPFNTWAEGAIDALKYDGLDKVDYVNVPTCLSEAERYNGTGYRAHGIYSPYVWAGTNHYDGYGKYTGDGHFSSSAKEDQLGVACIIKALLMINV